MLFVSKVKLAMSVKDFKTPKNSRDASSAVFHEETCGVDDLCSCFAFATDYETFDRPDACVCSCPVWSSSFRGHDFYDDDGHDDGLYLAAEIGKNWAEREQATTDVHGDGCCLTSRFHGFRCGHGGNCSSYRH